MNREELRQKRKREKKLRNKKKKNRMDLTIINQAQSTTIMDKLGMPKLFKTMMDSKMMRCTMVVIKSE